MTVTFALACGPGCAPTAQAPASGAAPTVAPASPAAAPGGADAGGAEARDAGDAERDGPVLRVAGGLLKIQLCTEDVVRVAFARDAAFFARPTLATAPRQCPGAAFRVATDGGVTSITTSRLAVRVDGATGAVSFFDAAGRRVLAEKGRSIVPAVVQGEQTSSVRQEWAQRDDESLYGLGQHQHGLLDIKGIDLDLRQYNTEVYVPLLVSSAGYGVLWDNPSFARFGDPGDGAPLPGASGLYAAPAEGGLPGDVDAAAGRVDWTGAVVPEATGDHTFRTYSTGTVQLWVDGRLVIDHFRQDWLPNEDIARVRLTAGRPVKVRLSWSGGGRKKIIRLLWKPPHAGEPTTSLSSRVGDGVDYWFLYGPELDHVIAGYRRLTGQAPMMPRWAFGLWQCKERYATAQEVLDVLRGYRSRGAPVDVVVQDWRYWPDGRWGSHEFDPARYPDPNAWIAAIHDTYHARVMISVWPKFYPGTANYEALSARGLLYRPNLAEGKKDFLGGAFTVYDAFDPEGRRLYWSQIDRALFSRKVDAWWLDASEPEVVEGPFESAAAQVATNETHMTPTALGPGARVLNAFSLVHSQGVYEGQRATAPDQRVFILTRSGFAGQQRYAAATWSGDITSTWTAMKKQIPAGLGFALSGMPYWTFDSGGFAVPGRFSSPDASADDRAEWNELNTRWFEYATFVPILRVHGQSPPREIWQFGGEGSPAYAAMLRFDRLRHRMLPYVYSLAASITRDAGTMMRPLVMDFRADPAARAVGDEFMFGPALLVSPVTTHRARARPVYLPAGAAWYDFWTGRPLRGGQTIEAAAPFDAIPVHVRAGSIVPFGPELQYADEKPADPITLYVYAGADGRFTLYEDDGATYGYERGAFATIPLTWSDASRTLTIGARSGDFPGMLASRTFRVVVVGPTRPVGFSFEPVVDRSVTYAGAPVEVRLR